MIAAGAAAAVANQPLAALRAEGGGGPSPGGCALPAAFRRLLIVSTARQLF
jgi:hypothetical protein